MARKAFRELFPDGAEISAKGLAKFQMSNKYGLYWLKWLEDELCYKATYLATKGLIHEYASGRCKACSATNFKRLPKSVPYRIMFYAKRLKMI